MYTYDCLFSWDFPLYHCMTFHMVFSEWDCDIHRQKLWAWKYSCLNSQSTTATDSWTEVSVWRVQIQPHVLILKTNFAFTYTRIFRIRRITEILYKHIHIHDNVITNCGELEQAPPRNLQWLHWLFHGGMTIAFPMRMHGVYVKVQSSVKLWCSNDYTEHLFKTRWIGSRYE